MSIASEKLRNQHPARQAPSPSPVRLLSWLAIALFLSQTGVTVATTSVILQLWWLNQFKFAGFYAALENGYYREVGLDVTIKEGGPGINPVDDVLKGKADFGISNSSLVINYLQGEGSRDQPSALFAAMLQIIPFSQKQTLRRERQKAIIHG